MSERERRQEDRDTMIVAARADQKIDNHMDDCVRFRLRIESALERLAAKTDKNTWMLGGILGSLMLLREALELYLTYKK